jgi:homoaconitase/3-isopropylmalate dehydratase large subunit
MSHTATWRSVVAMKKVGATKLYDPDRLAIVLDHISPAKTEKNAKDHQTSRNFARDYGIKKFYDVDAGIAHLVLMENGHIKPGDLIVGTDSHCTIYGALGALGTARAGRPVGLAQGQREDAGRVGVIERCKSGGRSSTN